MLITLALHPPVYISTDRVEDTRVYVIISIFIPYGTVFYTTLLKTV